MQNHPRGAKLRQKTKGYTVSFKSIVGLLGCILMSLVSTSTMAQQSQFLKATRGQQTEFNYQWRYQNTEYAMSFAINTATLYAMPPSPPNYSAQIFQENVYAQVMHTARGIDPRLAKINIRKNNSGLSFNVSSRQPNQAQTILDKLTKAHDKAQRDYLAQHYFVRYTPPNGNATIRHDHAKYTLNSSLSLLPVVEAIKQLQMNLSDPREFITIALGWLQTIPYNQLEDRLSSNGAGFVSPRDLLWQNQGDCDSKSTLLAALMRAYNPSIDVKMVYLPDHALLAIHLRADDNDMSLQVNGKDYVLVEPTGPAQFDIGEVADSTKLSLNNRQFDLASMTL